MNEQQSSIPKVIYTYKDPTRRENPIRKLCVNSWKIYNPDYVIKYLDSDTDFFIFILKNGGVWISPYVICRGPLGPLIDNYDFVAYKNKRGLIEDFFIASIADFNKVSDAKTMYYSAEDGPFKYYDYSGFEYQTFLEGLKDLNSGIDIFDQYKLSNIEKDLMKIIAPSDSEIALANLCSLGDKVGPIIKLRDLSSDITTLGKNEQLRTCIFDVDDDIENKIKNKVKELSPIYISLIVILVLLLLVVFRDFFNQAFDIANE